MEEKITIMTVLQELRDFRAENNKRWEENNKRWEQNEKRWEENGRRWEQNEKRWEENHRRWEQNEKRWEDNDKRWISMEERVEKLEEGRKEDRREIFEVIDNMQKNIDNQFKEMRDYMDLKFEKIDLALAVNNMEHAEFRKLLKAYGIRLDFYGARLQSLEKWRDELLSGGDFVGAYK